MQMRPNPVGQLGTVAVVPMSTYPKYTIQNLPMVEPGHRPAQLVAARYTARCSGPTINIENVTLYSNEPNHCDMSRTFYPNWFG